MSPRPVRRILVPSVLAAVVVGLLGAGGRSASAAPAVPRGHVDRIAALPGGKLAIRGWALDPAAPSRSIRVVVFIDGKRIKSAPANLRSPKVNRARRTTGRHGFALTIARPRSANRVRVWAVRAGRGSLLGGTVYLIRKPARRLAGARIIAEARRYLGVPYVYGGASPSGFDCSGYTQWVYRHAHVATLLHNSELQRHQVRIIRRAAARPGDLIFYLSGGQSYHVTIYAGGNQQYAAPAPGQRVKREAIWSTAVQFGTDWH